MSHADRSSPPMGRRTALANLSLAALATGVSVSGRSRGQESVDLARLLRISNVPSLSVAMVDEQGVTTRAEGLLRVREPATVTADTGYAAASLTKTVFAYLFLSLVHDGLIELDRPVREYLPLPNPDDPHAAGFTARRFLSHTSGWPNWRGGSQPMVAGFEPGSRWSYSGEGFFFLQRVAEKVTGKGIGRLARELVFEPLGMKRSSLVRAAELEAFQASGHNGRGDPGTPFGQAALAELRRLMAGRGLPLDAATTEDTEQAYRTVEPSRPPLPNGMSPNAAASMLTTAADFGLFLRHLVTARRRGGASAAIVAMMMTPQVRCNEAVHWGLGVGLEDFGGRLVAWQWGDNPGFKNIFFADPGRDKAIAVFTNGDRGARVYERVVRAMTGEDHPGFLWI